MDKVLPDTQVVRARSDEARIRLALTSTWQTAEAPSQKPTVHDEVEHVGFYLANVLYRTLPVFYEAFADAIEAVYGHRIAVPKVVRFGTWVGGRSAEHTSELQSLMRRSYAVFCLK